MLMSGLPPVILRDDDDKATHSWGSRGPGAQKGIVTHPGNTGFPDSEPRLFLGWLRRAREDRDGPPS